MSTLSRVIALLGGKPVITEDGLASEAITPGKLVAGMTSIALNDATGVTGVPRVALERDEMGKDIDVDYAIGDTVKVGHFHAGQRFLGWVASGFNSSAGAFVEPAADGFVAAGTTNPIGFVTETANVTVATRITVEVI